MTDREMGRAIAMRCNIIVTDEGLDLLGRTARELLTAGDVWDAGEIKVQLDRIEKKLEDIESRLEMVPKVDREGYAGLHPNIAAGLVALGNRSLRNQP